jgi:hypothetical protein
MLFGKGNLSNGASLEMNKIYLVDKGLDSAPTNFNKRVTSTSQDQRVGYSRGQIDST